MSSVDFAALTTPDILGPMIGVVVTAVAVLGLMTVMPGPDMAVVTRAGLSGGRGAALRATFGVVAGLMV